MKTEHIAIAAVGTTILVGAAFVLGRKKKRPKPCGPGSTSARCQQQGGRGRLPKELQPGETYQYVYKTMNIVIARLEQDTTEGHKYSWLVAWANGTPARLGTAVSFQIAKSQAEASFEEGGS